jgi:hypothetical protein
MAKGKLTSFDISDSIGGTEDSRKKVASPAGTSNWDPTMISGKGPKASKSNHPKSEYDIVGGSGGTLDPRKKPAKPAGTSNWDPTMI